MKRLSILVVVAIALVASSLGIPDSALGLAQEEKRPITIMETEQEQKDTSPPIDPVVLFIIPEKVKVSFNIGKGMHHAMTASETTEFQIGEPIALTLACGCEGECPPLAKDVILVISNEAGEIIWNESTNIGYSTGSRGWAVGIWWTQVDNDGEPIEPGRYKAGVIFKEPTFDFPEDFSEAISLTITDIRIPPPEWWSKDIRLTNTHVASHNPSISVDSDNAIHIVWAIPIYKPTDSGGLFYTKIDNNGKQIITKVTPNATSTGTPQQITLDSEGNAHIVWWEGRWTGRVGIHYTKLDKNGNFVIDDKLIDSNESYLPEFPSIAVDSKGDGHVIFNDPRRGFFYLKLDNEGNVLKTIQVANVTNIGLMSQLFAYFSAIAVDSQDNVHLAWVDGGVKYGKFDSDGDKLISNLKISSNSQNRTTQPSIAIDSLDNVHIVWNTEKQIYYAKLDKNGNPLFTDKLITSKNGKDRSPYSGLSYSRSTPSYGIVETGGEPHQYGIPYPSLAIDKEDILHLSWEDDREGNVEIYYIQLDNNGEPLIPETRLTSYGGPSSSPSIEVDIDNAIYIVWHDIRHGSSDIYYKCYEMAPEEAWKEPIPTPEEPGFEAVFSIAGLLAVAYLVLRKKRK